MTTTATHGTVVLDIDDGLAHVRLNRPDSLNSLTREVFEDLVEIGTSLLDAPTVNAVVLSGEGRAFCAGLDLGEFQRMKTGEKVGGTKNVVAQGEPLGAAKAIAQKAVHVWSLVPVPVIAGVTGVAFGGGLQVALGADVRIVARDAKLSMMELNWGLAPDMGGTQLLPRLVGPAQAKLLVFTGKVIDGERAERIGLADEIAEDPVARALEIGRDLAERSRTALVRAKELVDLAGSGASLAEGFAREQEVIAELMGSPEQIAAVEKRQAILAARKQAKSDEKGAKA
ncbi:enoyl-CoA hydratase-related protein [Brevibacterium samyangense]|uniref:Crotonase/enoyl-CoA hydratase family protein n=1 Tax=Brevibacterium samyangense TaxID=366888 RepID=A0ABN2TEN4_9MICO